MCAETTRAPAHTLEILITLSVICLWDFFTSCGLASARLHRSLETVMFALVHVVSLDFEMVQRVWSPCGGGVLRWEACDPTVAGTSHLPERLCSLLAFALFQGFCLKSGCALCFRSVS